MPPRTPARRRPSKPRAWRVTDQKLPSVWRRLALPLIAAGVAISVGAGLLGAAGVFSAGAQPTPLPSGPPSRQIVSSTISGNTPTATTTPLPVTPVPAVGAAQQPTPGLTIQPAPPATVQQVTPVNPPSPAQPQATPSSLPGSLVPASARRAPTATKPAEAAPPGASIADELKAINATATALTERAAAPSGSATPAASGTPRPTATDTPIPTAAPPIVPRPSI